MSRMKSLTQHPPFSFQFIQVEAGQKEPFVGSFNSVVEKVRALRIANPYLVQKYGWRTDLEGVEFDVEQQNVARCRAHGWSNFILEDNLADPPVPPQKKTLLPGVAGAKRVAAGVAVLLDWLGTSGRAVDPLLAERRAAVCATCPKNDGGDWKAYFTGPISEKIRTQLEMRNDLALKTSHDDKLTVCSACDCPLRLKVFVPFEYIAKHISEDTKTRLDPRCWILSELKEQHA